MIPSIKPVRLRCGIGRQKRSSKAQGKQVKISEEIEGRAVHRAVRARHSSAGARGAADTGDPARTARARASGAWCARLAVQRVSDTLSYTNTIQPRPPERVHRAGRRRRAWLPRSVRLRWPLWPDPQPKASRQSRQPREE